MSRSVGMLILWVLQTRGAAAKEMEDVIIKQFIDAVESISNFPWLAASRTSILTGTTDNLAMNLQA